MPWHEWIKRGFVSNKCRVVVVRPFDSCQRRCSTLCFEQGQVETAAAAVVIVVVDDASCERVYE